MFKTRWEGARSGQTFEVTNPATGEVGQKIKSRNSEMGGNFDMLQVLCSVPDMSTEDTQVIK